MKLITRPNDVSGLKILLASEFQGISLELSVSAGSEKTVLVVNEDCQLLSCNAAVWYIFCLGGQKRNNSQQDKWLDWESTSLNPEVKALLTKNPHQIETVLDHLDKSLRNKFILGVCTEIFSFV